MKRSTPIHLSNNLRINILQRISETKINDMINTSIGQGKVLFINKDYVTVDVPDVGVINI